MLLSIKAGIILLNKTRDSAPVAPPKPIAIYCIGILDLFQIAYAFSNNAILCDSDHIFY